MFRNPFEQTKRHRMRLFAGALLAAMAAVQQPAAAEDSNERFLRAIHDAAVPMPDRVFDQLIPITRSNQALEWEKPDADARVKMVTWMTESTFQRYYNTPPTLPAESRTGDNWSYVIWATPVPQVRDFCRSLTGDTVSRSMRLKQLLGLSPERDYQRFVEFWVSPKDLLRPCPDPEINDSRCELTNSGTVPVDYKTWFVNNFPGSYSVTGAPWTRLGYTYDYAPLEDTANPRKPYRASEYIVRPGIAYTITGRYTTAEYCGATASN